MPCFTALARKLNLFSRDASELTRVDVAFTYIFIFVALYILVWYSHKYFELAAADFRKCDGAGNQTSAFCVKVEIIHKGVPYIGVLNGFLIALFRGLNMLALFINYACCCFHCCRPQTNPNNVSVTTTELKLVRESNVRESNVKESHIIDT